MTKLFVLRPNLIQWTSFMTSRSRQSLVTALVYNSCSHQVDHSAQMSSKGKTPWMMYNGRAVADSQFCIEHLKAERDLDLDLDLSPTLRAQARAFRALIEENLYW